MTSTAVRTFRASAPVRLDFAGGWTDVAPFADCACGVVVNAAIELRTRITLDLGQNHYTLSSADLAQTVHGATLDALQLDGKLDLLKAAVRRAGLPPCTVHSVAAAPRGSGLGTSGALSVALVHAIDQAHDRRQSALAMAHDAWHLETVDAGVAGGKQDQCAAALGGFQCLRFDRGATAARALDVSDDFAAELAARVVVGYTGQSRFSGDTIARVMQAFADGDATIGGALRAMADIASAMAGALERQAVTEIGSLLTANWQEQQRLDPGMCTPEMHRLEQAMAAAGAAGGKAVGAGAGGSMMFVVPGDAAGAIRAAEACGARIVPVVWARDGVRAE